MRSTIAVITILAAAASLGLASALLPDEAYERWSSLRGTVFDETRWIYERCHFDPTPIDVAIIGNSRVRQGIDAPRLEQDLARRGIHAHVVNFAIVSPGRGSDYAILQEVEAAKHPKLIIYGISADRQNWHAHPAYKYIATRSMMVGGLSWRNYGYLSDMLYIPYRQLKLFFSRWADPASASSRFDVAKYAGESLETVGAMPFEGMTMQNLTHAAPLKELRAEAAQMAQIEKRRPSLVSRLAGRLADTQDRHYLKLLARTAHANGSSIVFLFVPSFGGAEQVRNLSAYDGLGQVWNASFLAQDASLWGSAVHLATPGAAALTDWLANPVASSLKPGWAGRVS